MSDEEMVITLQMVSAALTAIKHELDDNNQVLHELAKAMVEMNQSINDLKPTEIPF